MKSRSQAPGRARFVIGLQLPDGTRALVDGGVVTHVAIRGERPPMWAERAWASQKRGDLPGVITSADRR